jgi:CheY-like chemotaxis protein
MEVDSQAVLRVRDSGIGISPEALPHIWDMFMQVTPGLDRARGGLGVGLTLVRSLVQAHDGTVEVHSDGLGKGSEFVVRLPLAGDELSGQASDKPCEPRAAVPSRRILVVDDNADQAGSMGMLLRLAGHEVRVAHDGPSALEVAGEFRPEVVLLDIGLPGINGYEVARRMRGELGMADALIVALSGYGGEDDRRKSAEAGFNAHLVKPADPGALQDLLAKMPEAK